MENNKKDEKEKQSKQTNYFIESVKKNYKIIIIIGLVLISLIIIINNTDTDLNAKKNIKGGSAALATQVAVSGLSAYSKVASKCTSGIFIQSAERFNAIIDNIKFVIMLIIAIILIPAFPVFFYIMTVYVIISTLVGNMIQS